MELVRIVVESVRIPVTVKMRLGWDSTQLTAPSFAREFEQVGVAAVAIHGRTREQGFSGVVDRTGFARLSGQLSEFLSSAMVTFDRCRWRTDVCRDRLPWHFDGTRSLGQSVDLSTIRRMGNDGTIFAAGKF